MNTSLATNGMPDLQLNGLATTQTVGGSAATVKSACDNLNTYANNLNTFIDNLVMQQNHILNGWEGAAADTLRQCFPDLIEAFTQIPPSVRSIADWAETTMNNYVSSDEDTASKISQIIGGGR